jgi:ribonuclease HI
MSTNNKSQYYAVKKGHNPDVYVSWIECKKQIDGFSGAVYKKFEKKEDADTFINKNNPTKFKQQTLDMFLDIKPTEITIESEVESKPSVYIFCDGSAIHQNYKSIRCGFGVYIIDHENNHMQFNRHINDHGTNNQAELSAILFGLNMVDQNNWKSVCFVSDSKYSLDCIQVWSHQWKKNNWLTANKKPVENQDIIKLILEKYDYLKTNGYQILFKHVNSHKSKPNDISSQQYFLWFGNEMADQLAKNGSITSEYEKPSIMTQCLNMV